MSQPAISVLMPVKNGLPFIEEAISSILEQTFGDFEIVVIDDGSDDATYDYLSSIDDHRIRLFRNEQSLGVTETLIRGWALCRADLVARMDADDISFPTRFERQIDRHARDHQLCVLGTGATAFGDREFHWKVPEEHDALQAYLMFDCVFPHTSVMMRKSAMDGLGLGYDATFKQAQDYELWTRTSIQGQLGGINEPLVKYRFHSNTVTVDKAEDQRRYADIVRSYALRKNLGYALAESEATAMRQLAGVFAHRFAKTGDELAETRRLMNRLLQAASHQEKVASFKNEIDARWQRVVNWATPEARQAIGL